MSRSGVKRGEEVRVSPAGLLWNRISWKEKPSVSLCLSPSLLFCLLDSHRAQRGEERCNLSLQHQSKQRFPAVKLHCHPSVADSDGHVRLKRTPCVKSVSQCLHSSLNGWFEQKSHQNIFFFWFTDQITQDGGLGNERHNKHGLKLA